MTVKLAEAWRTRTAALRERLTAEHLEALRRARMGHPPATLLGWHLSSDTGATHEPPLVVIESIAQSLAECFPWSAPADLPGGRQWVDLRHETNELIKLIGELHEALAAGKIESALIRSMALGTMFARLAYLVLDGEAIASGAASGRARPKARANRRSNAEHQWDKVLQIVHEIDRAITPDVKFEERWRLIAEKYRDEESDDLPVAAAKKRLPAWRKKARDVRP